MQRRGSKTRTLAALSSGRSGAPPLRVTQLQASSTLAVVERKAETDDSPPEFVRKTVEVIGRGGGMSRVSDCPTVRCACAEEDPLDFDTSFAVDGDRLVYGGLDCEPRGVRVLAGSGSPRKEQRIPRARSAGLSSAGRFLAWGRCCPYADRPQVVTVFDRRANRVAYRWRSPEFLHDAVDLGWAVDAAGRLAIGYTAQTRTTYRSGYGVVEPRTRRLRKLGGSGASVGWLSSGRLVAFTRRSIVIRDLVRGRRRTVRLVPDELRDLIGIDDRCLLWRRSLPRSAPFERSVRLEVTPLPGGRRSQLCPR